MFVHPVGLSPIPFGFSSLHLHGSEQEKKKVFPNYGPVSTAIRWQCCTVQVSCTPVSLPLLLEKSGEPLFFFFLFLYHASSCLQQELGD
jgi:hypothetical protein